MAMKPRAMKSAANKKTKMMRGGMTKANAGASVKPGQKTTMKRGGMTKTKMMRGGMASKAGKASGGMTKKK